MCPVKDSSATDSIHGIDAAKIVATPPIHAANRIVDRVGVNAHIHTYSVTNTTDPM